MNDELFLETDEYDIAAVRFGEEDIGTRLDAALALHIEKVSRNRAQQLIEDGNVTVCGEIQLSKKYRIRHGDTAEAKLYKRLPIDVIPQDIALEIVFEDSDVIVINKPKGMVVHPAPGNETGTLVNALLYHMQHSGGGLSSINGKLRPGIVHRIDKNTSGLIMVAKNDAAHASLSSQLSEHSITRVYLAIAIGHMGRSEGTIDAPLARDPANRKKRKVAHGGTGKRAVTHYKIIEDLGKCSLVELRLETGRTHQIRVHMASIGHPILGDDLYGSADGDGQYLHAQTLGFVHPASGEYMEFSVPPSPEFQEMLVSLGGRVGSA